MLRLASEFCGPKWESLCVVPQRRFLSFRVEACGSGTCQIHKGDLEWRRCAGHTWGASADEKWRLNNTVWNTTFESTVTSVWQRQRASFTAPILCCLYLSAQNISLFFPPHLPCTLRLWRLFRYNNWTEVAKCSRDGKSSKICPTKNQYQSLTWKHKKTALCLVSCSNTQML